MQNPKQRRRAALTRQITRLDIRLAQLQRISDRYALLRLSSFVGGVLISGALWSANSDLTGIAIVITLIVFGGIVVVHRRFNNSIRRYRLWKMIKHEHIARSTLDWDHVPLLDDTPPDAAHPFAADLDLTGKRSIQHLLDTAVSLEGSRRLKAWLLNTTPDLDVIRTRQALVRELTPRALFRDKVTLNARLAAKDLNLLWDGKSLLDWLQGESKDESGSFPKGAVYLLSVLALGNVFLWVLSNWISVPSALQLGCFALYVIVYLTERGQIASLFEDALALGSALNKLQNVFRYLETSGYVKRPHLKTLCAPFIDAAVRPSVQIRQVTRIVSAASIQGNPLIWMILNAILPWDMYVAWQLRDAKTRLATLLPGWLDTWHELEALDALANFAYLNPACSFPIVRDDITSASQPVFEGRNLAHPLIPDEQRVGNDFNIDHLGNLVLITGSNMAGKSSFLRTLGVNLSLAYAGGVVNAVELNIPRFRVFTCIKISDSVTDGFSYFYAEVRRLKLLLTALEAENAIPLFFLIDEIFRGTNNRERLIGSRAYITALVGKNGTGIISTHDLELITLAETLPAIENAHFSDTVVDGRLSFDYKLRPGPCPTTNALKIMALEGLPVTPIELDVMEKS